MKKTFAIATLLCLFLSCKRYVQSPVTNGTSITESTMAPNAGGGGGNTWTLVGFSTAIARREGMCSFVINNIAYVFGGKDATTETFKKDLYRFNAAAGTWTQMASLPSNASGRADAVAFAINGKGYVATGLNVGTWLKDLWEFDPTVQPLGAWTQKVNLPGNSRAYAAGFAVNGKGYVGLGFAAGVVFKDMWEYDPVTNAWLQKADIPDEGRADPFVFVCNNKGYMGGGYHEITTLQRKDVWEYNPATNAWTQKSDYPGLAYHSYFAWSNNYSGFVGGGIKSDQVNDFWMYSPNIDTWTKKKDFPGYKRYGSLGFYVSSRGYAGFGVNSVYMSTNDIYRYEL
jgi:hypothetical protein